MKKTLLPLFTPICLIFAVVTTSIAQGSLSLNGTSQYARIELPDDIAKIQVEKTFTVEASIRASLDGGDNQIIISANPFNPTAIGGFVLGLNKGNPYFQIGGGEAPVYYGETSGHDIRDGKCHHIAASRNGSGNVTVYLDGLVYYQGGPSTSNDGSILYDIFIGYDIQTRAGFFKGSIDEIRLWKTEKKIEEIKYFSKNSVDKDMPLLLALWDFEEGNGQLAKNKTNELHKGKNFLQAYLGTNETVDASDPTWNTTGCLQPIPYSTSNKAISLEGNKIGKVFSSTQFLFGEGAVTFEAIIKANVSTNNVQMILSNRFPSQNRGFMFGLYDGHLFFQQGGTAHNGNHGSDHGPDLRDGKCHHVAFTKSAAGILSFYVDGELSYSVGASTRDISSAAFMYVGYDLIDAGNYFNGELDEVRIWSVVRSATEIKANSTKQISIPVPNLVGAYNFNEGIGQIFKDKSGNKLHGQLGFGLSVEPASDPTWITPSCTITNGFFDENRSETSFAKAFPNPFTDHITIESTLPRFQYTLYTLTGAALLSGKSESVQANIALDANWPSGIYLLEINDGNQSTFQKIVK